MFSMLMYTSWLVKLDRRTRERLSFAANTRLDSARMMLIKSKACETQATFRRLRFRFGGTRSIIEVCHFYRILYCIALFSFPSFLQSSILSAHNDNFVVPPDYALYDALLDVSVGLSGGFT